jgi:hypothetical protein
MEALGGMLFYLESLHLDKDLVSQKNFNVYDPIKEGKNLVLDGQTLGHMEVSLRIYTLRCAMDLILFRSWSIMKGESKGRCWNYCRDV